MSAAEPPEGYAMAPESVRVPRTPTRAGARRLAWTPSPQRCAPWSPSRAARATRLGYDSERIPRPNDHVPDEPRSPLSAEQASPSLPARIFFGPPSSAERRSVAHWTLDAQQHSAGRSSGTSLLYDWPTPPHADHECSLDSLVWDSPGVARAGPRHFGTPHQALVREALGDISNVDLGENSLSVSPCEIPAHAPRAGGEVHPSPRRTPVQSLLHNWASSKFERPFSPTRGVPAEASPLKPFPTETAPLAPVPTEASPLKRSAAETPTPARVPTETPPLETPRLPCAAAQDSPTPSHVPTATPPVPPQATEHARRASPPVIRAEDVFAPRSPSVPCMMTAHPNDDARTTHLDRAMPSPERVHVSPDRVHARRIRSHPATTRDRGGVAPDDGAPSPWSARPRPAAGPWSGQREHARGPWRSVQNAPGRPAPGGGAQGDASGAPADGAACADMAQLSTDPCTDPARTAARGRPAADAHPLPTPPAISTPGACSPTKPAPARLVRPARYAAGVPAMRVWDDASATNGSAAPPQAAPVRKRTRTEAEPQSVEEGVRTRTRRDHTSDGARARPALPGVRRPGNAPPAAAPADPPAAPALDKQLPSLPPADELSAVPRTARLRPRLHGAAQLAPGPFALPHPPSPPPISAVDLARLTARHTKQNEAYTVQIQTTVEKVPGARPPSPTLSFSSRAGRWMGNARQLIAETDEYGEPLQHAHGAGDEDEFCTPRTHETARCGDGTPRRRVHWDRRLVVSPSLVRGYAGRERRSCLHNTGEPLDAFGNLAVARSAPLPRHRVAVTRRLFDGDEE
ncbi:hypothetical protein MSPP1_003450 [Malassezia sp. CBS 17886]|nr:hypothetical protein MSPP1_003450 [Malassezia sp. CBS 17886]